MAKLHYEDGHVEERLTKKGVLRLHGVKRDGKRPIKIELSESEWTNPNFHFSWALNAVKPLVGVVVLSKELK